MKNQSLQLLSLSVITAIGFTACSGLGKFAKNANKITYTVSPNPMEMHGDSIIVSINGTYPAKIFPKKAVVTTIPVVKFNGGEKELRPVVLIGEKATGEGQKIANANGGKFAYTSEKFAYTPEMKQATLEVKVVGQVKKKTKQLPTAKIADGTIVTSLLVKNDQKPILGKDKFVKTIPRTQSASIYFVVNQSQVRSTELNNEEMKALKNFVTTGLSKGYTFNNMNISSYASPDGELTLNSNLAENRAKETSKALMALFKDKKLKVDVATSESFYNKVTTAEDWDGFKKAMEASSVPDKELILRVLTMYPDGEVREREIKNLSKTYVEVAENILPKLRRSVLTLNAEEKSRNDSQIKALANSSSDSLSVEELLYAATLTSDLNSKLSIYKKAQAQYPNDWRTHNNVGYIYLLQNKLSDATTNFEKAEKLAKDNDIVKNNLGIIAHWNGDRAKAMSLYKDATSAGPEVAYNMGIAEIQAGNYGAAVGNFGDNKTFNVALAKLLSGNADAAVTTLDASNDKDAAVAYYLKAVAGARQSKTEVVIENLKTAIQKDASFKQMAKEDAEFIKLRDNAEFTGATN